MMCNYVSKIIQWIQIINSSGMGRVRNVAATRKNESSMVCLTGRGDMGVGLCDVLHWLGRRTNHHL